MRVIAGSARGRRLVAPRVASLRPTSDRVREAIFDVLSSLGAVEGARVLDLFAGSGALGIEALSRGAAEVTFVDCDRLATEAIEANLATLGFTAGVRIVRQDAIAFCSSLRPSLRPPAGRWFDLALCDPPYRFEDWPRLLEVLPAHLAVLESARPITLAGGFQTHRSYRYGGTLVTVARRDQA